MSEAGCAGREEYLPFRTEFKVAGESLPGYTEK